MSDKVVKVDPQEQYAQYLADRLKEAYSYSDWHELTFGTKPEMPDLKTPDDFQSLRSRIVRVVNSMTETIGKKLNS